MPDLNRTPNAWSVVRRTLIACGIGTLLLGILIALLTIQDRHQVVERLRDQGLQRVEMAGQLMAQELRRTRAELLYLSDNEMLARFLGGDQESRAKVETDFVRFVEYTGSYDQIRCLDLEGHEIIRVNLVEGQGHIVSQEQLQAKSDRYYFREAWQLDRHEVFVSRFDLNVEHDELEQPIKPVLRFITPVYDLSDQKRGLIVLNCLGQKLLDGLAASRLVGETYLVNPQGDYLRAANPKDAWGWILGHSRTFRGDFETAWSLASAGRVGQWQTDQGLFACGIVEIQPDAVVWRSPTLPQMRDAKPDVPNVLHPDSMILVSHIPDAWIASESMKLLRPLIATGILALAVVAVVSFSWARAAARNALHARQVAESENRLRILSAELLTAQETERRAISREIHDSLGQLGTAVQLELKLADRQHEPSQIKELVRHATTTMEQLLRSMHEMASRVRLSALDDLGLRDAIQSTLRDFESRSGISVRADVDPSLDPVPTRVGEHIYRILQEALGNVVRHSQSSVVHVTVDRLEHEIQMSIRDEGTGMDLAESERKGRLGILGMRERVEIMGGTFLLQSQRGEGTTISLKIPIKNEPIESLERQE
jgi:signal transduction histidine kinase